MCESVLHLHLMTAKRSAGAGSLSVFFSSRKILPLKSFHSHSSELQTDIVSSLYLKFGGRLEG
jgi:hypothetical protein